MTWRLKGQHCKFFTTLSSCNCQMKLKNKGQKVGKSEKEFP